MQTASNSLVRLLPPADLANPDHITHHLVSLWALGASPQQIQDMWDFNTPYQTPLERDDAAAPASGYLDLSDAAVFDQCLGKDECYADFLKFFEGEIEGKGVQDVVREYVLRGDARADDIFCRMYTGELHARSTQASRGRICSNEHAA